MNYLNHYKNLIKKSKNRVLDENIKVEKHHIIPKSIETTEYALQIFGSLGQVGETIPLLFEEHWIAHLLLVRIFDEKSKYHNKNHYFKMIQACNRMLNDKKHIKVKNNKEYKWIREEFGKSMIGKNNPRYGKSNYNLWIEKYGKEIANQKVIEYSKKMSKSTSGENNGMYDKHHKEESCQQISKIRIEKCLAKGENNSMYRKCIYNIWIEKYGIEKANYLKEKSTSKMSETRIEKGLSKGKNNPLFKKTHYDIWLKKYGKEIADQKTLEWKKKNTESNSKKVYQYSLDKITLIAEYNSVKEAIKINSFNRNGIYCCCQGKIQSYNNFIWSYKKY